MKLLKRLFLLALMTALPTLASAQETLNLFNWTEYMNPKIIKQFEKKYNVKVVQTYYSSNSELLAKLMAGGDSQYDVVVPSNYMIERMAAAGLLMKLDKSKLSNFKNLAPQFQNTPYDPHDAYAIPYQWGTTALAYDTRKFKNPPQTWGVLFDPKVNPSYPFALMGGSGQDTLHAACAYLGYTFGCDKISEWKAAAKLVLETKQRHNFTGFVDGTPALHQLEKGVIAAGIVYNGDLANEIESSPQATKYIKYIIPKGGAEAWVDNMAIPAHAPNPGLAYKFINFILDAKIGAELSNWNVYASPNAAARPYLDKVLQSSLVQPTPEEWKRLYYMPGLKGEKMKAYQAIWNAVRTQ
ncbi:ABC transporter substrate-binding protein [Acidihalobacter ferrooxydans]|uniref:Putrescine-binding periplasmic protein n=1 Tax=Acidihalobacter ferrooxydans TaxID=1765967 RepID=A0A1P8UDJ3_9GAMM|nr:spermidine/putrescine ABC transporter substrate-binding protein [Acidihalobacter ferrooxydans]APZ41910.1 ABC transporter substrate-binding protein [Acidihalobacter ferrooxydans]